MVILLLGVMAAFTSQFIGIGTQIFGVPAAAEQLMSDARFALEQLNRRELRDAVPGSVRIEDEAGSPLGSGACLRFWPIVTASRYLGSHGQRRAHHSGAGRCPSGRGPAIVYPCRSGSQPGAGCLRHGNCVVVSPLLGHPVSRALPLTVDGSFAKESPRAAYLFCPPTGALLRDECRPDPGQRRYRH